jgi:hypothetical protein
MKVFEVNNIINFINQVKNHPHCLSLYHHRIFVLSVVYPPQSQLSVL